MLIVWIDASVSQILSNQWHFAIRKSLLFSFLYEVSNKKYRFNSFAILVLAFSLNPYWSKCTFGGQCAQTNSWGAPKWTPHINYSVRSPSLLAVSVVVFLLAVGGPALAYRQAQSGREEEVDEEDEEGGRPVDSLTGARRGLQQECSLKSPQERRHRRG